MCALPIAGDLGKGFGASAPGSIGRLEDYGGGAFANYKAVAFDVKRFAGLAWVKGVFGENPHAVKGGEIERDEAGLRGTSEDTVGLAIQDKAGGS